MIDAYLVWIASGFEGEDVEVRYSLFKDGELLDREAILIDYQKPLLAGQFAMGILLEKLEAYKGEDIRIIINDGALEEVIEATSTSRNPELQNMGEETRRKLEEFGNIEIRNVMNDHLEREKWNQILTF